MSYSVCQQCGDMVPNREPLCPTCGPHLYTNLTAAKRDAAKVRRMFAPTITADEVREAKRERQGTFQIPRQPRRPMPHPSGLSRAERRKRAAQQRRKDKRK